jgi:integrase
MAYIEKVDRNKPYVVVYYVNGNKRRKSFKTKKEANEFKKTVEAEKILGTLKDKSNVRLKDYAPMVFKIRDRKASFQTKQNRKYYLEKLFKMIGNWKIIEITAIRLKKLLLELSEENSDQVLIKYKQILNIVLDSAAEEDLIEYNPMLKVKFSISQKNLNEVKPISINDFKMYLTYARNIKKYYYGLLLMFYTGMRIGEVLALRLDDFNFEKNVIHVNKNLQKNMEIGEVKKGRSREYPIIEEIAELYYEVMLYHKNNERLMQNKYHNNNLFIAHEDGSYVSYNAFQMYLRRLDKKVGIKLRPHQLRHTFATFTRGLEIKDIQKMTGHKDIDTLVNIYQDHNGFRDETIQILQERYKKINIREK